jgi:hypothetical protein
MPYILKENRKKYNALLEELIGILKKQPLDQIDGEINYIVTRILKEVYPLRYFNLNRAVGVLESCKLEFYRRIVGPYEDKKIEENGDV